MLFQVERPRAVAPAFFDAVAIVFGPRAELQMLGIAAPPVIANVHQDHPLGDRPMDRLPGNAMNQPMPRPHGYAAITVGVAKARPQMTARLLVDLHACARPLGDRAGDVLGDRWLEGPPRPMPPVVRRAKPSRARMPAAAGHAAFLSHWRCPLGFVRHPGGVEGVRDAARSGRSPAAGLQQPGILDVPYSGAWQMSRAWPA
jgi:hypothetical protein